MRRRLTPREKKDRDLDEQIRPLLEAPHAFRKNWPKRKARANRRTRHVAKRVLDDAVKASDTEDLTARAIKSLQKGRTIGKHFVMPLRRRIGLNKTTRTRA